jgi:hypothetical protein
MMRLSSEEKKALNWYRDQLWQLYRRSPLYSKYYRRYKQVENKVGGSKPNSPDLTKWIRERDQEYRRFVYVWGILPNDPKNENVRFSYFDLKRDKKNPIARHLIRIFPSTRKKDVINNWSIIQDQNERVREANPDVFQEHINACESKKAKAKHGWDKDGWFFVEVYCTDSMRSVLRVYNTIKRRNKRYFHAPLPKLREANLDRLKAWDLYQKQRGIRKKRLVLVAEIIGWITKDFSQENKYQRQRELESLGKGIDLIDSMIKKVEDRTRKREEYYRRKHTPSI